MAEEMLVTVKTSKVEDKVSAKTNKPYKSLIIVDTDDNTFSGFVNKDTVVPDTGDTLAMKYQPVTTITGMKLNIVSFSKSESLGQPSTLQTAKKAVQKASESSKSVDTSSAVAGTATQKATGNKIDTREASIVVQAMLKSLIETKHYHAEGFLKTTHLQKNLDEVLEIYQEATKKLSG